MLNRIFGVSDKTFQFLFANRKSFLTKLMVILPLAFWTSVVFQIQPIFFKFSIDAVTEKQTGFQLPFTGQSINFDSTLYYLTAILLVLLGLNMLDKILSFVQERILQKLNYQISSQFEDNFTMFMSKFDSSFIGAENNMRLVDDINWQIRSIEPKITGLISKVITIPTSIITILFILPLIHWSLVVFVLVYSLINLAFENIAWLNWQKYEVVRSRVGGISNRIRSWIIHYFPRVIGSGWVTKLWKLYRTKREEEFELNFEQDEAGRRITLAKNLVLNIMDAFSKVLAGFLVITSAITIGTFVVFEQYVGRFRSIFEDLAALIRDFIEIRLELFKIDFVLNLKSKLDYSNIEPLNLTTIDSIEMSQVNFTYPKFYGEEKEYFNKMKTKLSIITEDIKIEGNWLQRIMAKIQKNRTSDWRKRSYQKTLKELDKMLDKDGEAKEILHGLNLKLEKGQMYGIVGYNGAGKSTLVSLIKRNLDPSMGLITINGNRNLTTIDPGEWKTLISSLEQKSVIWPGISIRDNLLLGATEAITEDQMWTAIDRVGLRSEIKDLDLIYGEGVELSGGQEQLIELARVILQAKPLVILDEGTNQLDAMKEANIINIMNEIKKNAIVIFISHRMTSSSKCNQIIVLDQGLIQTIGTHKELIKSGQINLYKEMWQLQVGSN